MQPTLIGSSKKDVSLSFSTANAFRRQVQMGGLDVVKQAIQNDSKVRILIPGDEHIEQTLNQAMMMMVVVPQATFRIIDKSLETRLSILVVDGQESLVFELKDDTIIDNSYEAIGIATYSDSRPIASSYATIFESLWKQSELYEKLKVNDKLQKEFINVAAHELRTPVQPILGFSEILVSMATSEKQRQVFDVILRNAKRLQHLTDDILQVSRIESNLLVLNKEQTDISELVITVAEEFKETAKLKGIHLEYPPRHHRSQCGDDQDDNDGAGPDLIVCCDRKKIIQVMDNLLSNALRFTEKEEDGAIRIAIFRMNDNDNDDVAVTIRDTGSGIDVDILPRLFTKFATRSFQGNGLGLYIAKKIVEAHGGEIWGENNNDGKGATFGFSLPLCYQCSE